MKNQRSSLCLVAFLAVALLAPPAAAQVKDHTKIKYPKLPEFKIAEPEIYELENGMKVFLIASPICRGMV